MTREQSKKCSENERSVGERMKFNTALLHQNFDGEKSTGSTIMPIYQVSAFAHETAEKLEKVFHNQAPGFAYTRISNPTVDAFEKRVAAMENGIGAVSCSSGMTAVTMALLNILHAGDEVIAGSGLFGGTIDLFSDLKAFGITTRFAESITVEEIEPLINENTKVVFTELIGNPKLDVVDVKAVSELVHAHGIPLIIDSTTATPYLIHPFAYGADVVVHSSSKYINGGGNAISGVIVDSGNFDWEAHAEKFPGLCQPDPSYHGLTYTKAFGKLAFITKATSQLMRDLGAIQSPQNAFLLNLGLETLHLRVPQHCKNALAVAQWLQKCDKVAWVHYPELEGNPYHELAKKYLPNGSCGVLSFGLKGGREVAIKFMDSLKLAAIVTHVADARTCVLHPASHTHRQLSDEQLIEAGVAPDLIRFSVGIENADDIIADIEQALNK